MTNEISRLYIIFRVLWLFNRSSGFHIYLNHICVGRGEGKKNLTKRLSFYMEMAFFISRSVVRVFGFAFSGFGSSLVGYFNRQIRMIDNYSNSRCSISARNPSKTGAKYSLITSIFCLISWFSRSSCKLSGQSGNVSWERWKMLKRKPQID